MQARQVMDCISFSGSACTSFQPLWFRYLQQTERNLFTLSLSLSLFLSHTHTHTPLDVIHWLGAEMVLVEVERVGGGEEQKLVQVVE